MNATATAKPQPAGPDVSCDTITPVPLDAIRKNPHQPRTDFGELEGMAETIRLHGIQQPVTVHANGDGSYTLIAGERRVASAKLAGLREIPAIVRTGDTTILALLENLQRKNLKPLEEAAAFKQAIDGRETQESLAAKLGISRDRIAQSVRLLALPREGAFLLDNGEISPSAARQILRLNLLDEVATRESFADTWANWFAHLVLWHCEARTTADVQYCVDRFLGDLAECVRDYEAMTAADAEARAQSVCEEDRGRNTLRAAAARKYLLLRPAWSKLLPSHREEFARSALRWAEEYERRHPRQVG